MPDTQQHDDEIDLFELVQTLWDGKWLLAGISSAALAMGGAYVVFTPDTFDASIIVRPLDSVAMAQYLPLQTELRDLVPTLTLSMQLQNGDVPEQGDESPIASADSFLSAFAEALLQREVISDAIRSAGALDPQNYDTENGYNQDLRNHASRVEISQVNVPAPTLSGTATAWNLTLESDDAQIPDRVFAEILMRANEVSQNNILDRLSAVANGVERSASQRIAEIEHEMEISLQGYPVLLEDQLTYLSEQATLARALDIELGVSTGAQIHMPSANIADLPGAMT